MPVKPRLDILPDAQKEMWPLLREIPQDFVLYGGTAVALRYGHRVSVDFDFFSSLKDTRIIDTTSNLDFIRKYAINYATPSFLTAESGSQIIYKLKMGNKKEVEITFLRDTEFIKGAVNKPSITEDNNIKIASPLDLMATKIIALISRKSVKDFIDICTLIQNGVSLENGIAAAIALKSDRENVLNIFHAMHNALIIPDNYKILFDNDKESPMELKDSLPAVVNTLIPALKHISIDKINHDVKLFKPLSGEAGDA